MEGLLVLGILVVAGLLVWLQICVAKEFQRIAAMKGHEETRYFWWTFLMGPVGMMMVIALPQKAAAPEEVKPDELPEI